MKSEGSVFGTLRETAALRSTVGLDSGAASVSMTKRVIHSPSGRVRVLLVLYVTVSWLPLLVQYSKVQPPISSYPDLVEILNS